MERGKHGGVRQKSGGGGLESETMLGLVGSGDFG